MWVSLYIYRIFCYLYPRIISQVSSLTHSHSPVWAHIIRYRYTYMHCTLSCSMVAKFMITHPRYGWWWSGCMGWQRILSSQGRTVIWCPVVDVPNGLDRCDQCCWPIILYIDIQQQAIYYVQINCIPNLEIDTNTENNNNIWD